MATTYPQFYKKFGIRILQQFIGGNLNSIDDLNLPLLSCLHFLPFKSENSDIKDEHIVFNNGKRNPVYSVISNEGLKGRVREVNFNLAKEVAYLKKVNKKFKFMMSPTVNKVGSPNTLVIFNYGLFRKKYKYGENPLNGYYKWYNLYKAYLNNLNSNITNDTRKQYVLINIPDPIPKLTSIVKHSKRITLNTVKEFKDPNSFTVLDICMWLNPKTREDSLLSMLGKDQLNNTIYIINNGISWTALNIGKLDDFNKDSVTREGNTSVGFKQLTSMFLVLLARVSGSSSFQEFTESNLDLKDGKLVKIEELAGITDDLLVHHESEIIESSGLEEELIDVTPVENSKRKIQSLSDSGSLSNPEKKKLLSILEKQETISSPYGNGKLKDNLIVTKEDITFKDDDITIPDSNLVLDKTMNKSTIKAIDRTYIKNTMKKHTLKMLYSLQNNGIIITDHSIEKQQTVMGGVEIHKIKVKPINGKASVLNIRLPIVDEEGVFRMSGNKYTMRKQRADLPIRKIDSNVVSLTTYYGKLFITRAFSKSNDISFWLKNKILKEYMLDDSTITKLVTLEVLKPDWKVPKLYSTFARYIKTFTINKNKFYFDYSNRSTIWEGELSEIEKQGKVLVGVGPGKNPIVMDKEGNVFIIKDGTETKLDHLYEQLSLDTDKMPVEFLTMRIFSKRIPLAAILVYYMGISGVLKQLKTNYTLTPLNERVSKDNIVIKLKDVKIVIPKSDLNSTLLLEGLNTYKDLLKDYDFKELQNNKPMIAIFTKKKIPGLYIKELDLMNDMFIDPISKEVLERMKEPTTFKGLLFRSVEMLTNNNFKNSQDLSEMLIKGYERIPGMFYKRLVESTREFQNKNIFSTAKLQISPYSVWSDINNDPTTMVYDDLNPIANIKQFEDITYLGAGMGRNKQSMVKRTRQFHKSDIGVVSEAVKDSGDVGISMYMSANPEIQDTMGARGKRDIKNGNTSLFSTSSLLAPGSLTDDPKRNNFIQIQNSHTVAITGQEQAYVRTGYESVLPYRSGSDFITVAEHDGKVIAKSKNKLRVEYKNGDKDTFKLGNKATKIENEVAYKQSLISNHSKGDIFNKNDILVYNESFFTRDFFDKSKIVYKTGTTLKVAMIEDAVTDEDSCSISKNISSKLSTNLYKIKSFIVTSDQEVFNIANIGAEVKQNSILFTIKDKDAFSKELDKETIELLSSIKNRSPKAKVDGTVDKIVIYYNSEIEELSPSLKKLAIDSDKNEGIKGQVTNEYSIQGKPLIKGNVEIKVYISAIVGAGLGDKGVFGNQLKTTIGEVYQEEILAEDGSEIDALFGQRSVMARIVQSPLLIGTTTTLLKVIAKKAVEIYK